MGNNAQAARTGRFVQAGHACTYCQTCETCQLCARLQQLCHLPADPRVSVLCSAHDVSVRDRASYRTKRIQREKTLQSTQVQSRNIILTAKTSVKSRNRYKHFKMAPVLFILRTINIER